MQARTYPDLVSENVGWGEAQVMLRPSPAEAAERRSPSAADSFADGVLDCPHYTRPAQLRGHAVPEPLLSGDHAKVARWRRKEALRATRERRPDLLRGRLLSADDQALLLEIEEDRGTRT